MRRDLRCARKYRKVTPYTQRRCRCGPGMTQQGQKFDKSMTKGG